MTFQNYLNLGQILVSIMLIVVVLLQAKGAGLGTGLFMPVTASEGIQDNVTTLVSMRMTSFPRSPRFVLPARRRPAVRTA